MLGPFTEPVTMRGFPQLSFAVKFSLAISALAVGMTTISVSLMYGQLYGLLVRQTAGRLKDVAQTGSFLFDESAQASLLRVKALSHAQSRAITAEMLALAPGETTATLDAKVAQQLMASQDFQALVQIMRRIGEASRATMLPPVGRYQQANPAETINPITMQAYLMVSLPESPDHQLVKFIADGLYEPQGNWPGNPVGNLYRIPDDFFAQAFEGTSQIAPSFYTDEFGSWLTAVVPIKNSRGQVIATLGLDFDATQEVAQVEQLRWICVAAILVSLVLSVGVSVALARWLGPPIAELQAGAERVSRRDYRTFVRVESPNELKLLAIAFNSMVREIRSYAKSLEKQNRALEFRVQERTQELAQTLEVLKQTQAELLIENDLLRTAEVPSRYEYQVGGSLPLDAPTYVVRQSDREVYRALRRGEYCYILNARQMGKSSLRVQMMKRMQPRALCVAIDLSVIGTQQTSIEQWYTGFIYVLARSIESFPRSLIKSWLQEHLFLSPLQRLEVFVHDVLLEYIQQDIVVFIDEIDSVLGLEFEVDDFFIWIRNCFNRRADEPQYRRLIFVLLGVATPSHLILDKHRTPFNIGKAIELQGFQLHEAYPLLRGFPQQIERPQVVLQQILAWTAGQPFLTQKVCQLLRDRPIPSGQEQDVVEAVVQSQLIHQWELHDIPEHLKSIRDRLLRSSISLDVMLALYEQVITAAQIPLDNSPEQSELLLSGLVVSQRGHLQVANQIYSAVFDQAWVSQTRVLLSLPPNPVFDNASEPVLETGRESGQESGREANLKIALEQVVKQPLHVKQPPQVAN